MKKGKPPRRTCPHLRLTVVRQAGGSVLLGPGQEEQTQWEVPGEMGRAASGLGHRVSPACQQQVALLCGRKEAQGQEACS